MGEFDKTIEESDIMNRLSIVVPVYNAEKYLCECINSVIAQSNPNWELVLIDDGSLDNSGIICDNYANKYDNIVAYHKENEGQFVSRLYGIKKASYEYVGFLDADDYLCSHYVNDVLKILDLYYPQILCFGFFEVFDSCTKEYELPFDNELMLFSGKKIGDFFKEIINQHISGAMWSKVFLRDYILRVSLDCGEVNKKRFGEDAFQSYNYIIQANLICAYNKSLYYYRFVNNSASKGFENRELDYFNTKYVYKVLMNGIDYLNMDTDSQEIVQASNFNGAVYRILRYYRAAKTAKRRKEIVNYDWSTYLLDMTDDDIAKNSYIRKSYIKVWNAFKKKRHFEIYIRERIKKIGWG